VEFVVDKAALGRFSPSTSVSPANHSTNFSIIIIVVVIVVFILCRMFIVCVVLYAVFRLVVVLFCVMCVIGVLCLIVLPLPPGKCPFAVKINNNNHSRLAQ
jgi:hypothetical protein